MSNKTIIAAAVVAALSTGMLATVTTPAFAADDQAKSTTTQTQKDSAEQDLIKVSEDALMTMRNIRGARLSIFNGSPDKAQVFADAAATRVAATLADADKYALDVKKSVKDGDEYVPFNASLAVTETMVPSAEKMKHIAKANEHLHKGETKKALEVLKLGDVNVALTTELVPLKSAKVHIEDAAKLIGEGKYYEANLALKAVEDSIVIDTFDIDAIPKVKTHS